MWWEPRTAAEAGLAESVDLLLDSAERRPDVPVAALGSADVGNERWAPLIVVSAPPEVLGAPEAAELIYGNRSRGVPLREWLDRLASLWSALEGLFEWSVSADTHVVLTGPVTAASSDAGQGRPQLVRRPGGPPGTLGCRIPTDGGVLALTAGHVVGTARTIDTHRAVFGLDLWREAGRVVLARDPQASPEQADWDVAFIEGDHVSRPHLVTSVFELPEDPWTVTLLASVQAGHGGIITGDIQGALLVQGRPGQCGWRACWDFRSDGIPLRRGDSGSLGIDYGGDAIGLFVGGTLPSERAITYSRMWLQDMNSMLFATRNDLAGLGHLPDISLRPSTADREVVT